MGSRYSRKLFKPELITYSKEWTYPSNTIDTTSGAARSAVSWAVQLKADKDRYFKEPGFLVGVCVAVDRSKFTNWSPQISKSFTST